MKKFFLLLSVLILASCATNSDDSMMDDQDDDGINDYLPPFVDTIDAQRVSLTTARFNGFIELAPLSVGDFQVGNSAEFETKGFVWGTIENPNLDNANIYIAQNNNEGPFHAVFEDLSQETQYYYRAFAINADDDIEYGLVKTFTTNGPTPCNYTQDNLINILGENPDIPVDSIDFTNPGIFSDGNIEFTTSTGSSTVKIIIGFDELDGEFPVTGLFSTISDFQNLALESVGQARLGVSFNGGTTTAMTDQGEFYVEHIPNDRITFIFCETQVGSTWVVNGKFTLQL